MIMAMCCYRARRSRCEAKMSVKLKWTELNGECNLKEAPVAGDFNGGQSALGAKGRRSTEKFML